MKLKLLFVALLALAVSPLGSPPVALALGLGFGLAFENPYRAAARSGSRRLLSISVVGLGFALNLGDVVHAGRSGFLYTAVGIALALALGLGLGRALGVGRTEAFLIAAGTAVCGGSAIAALGPVSGADDDEMSVSLATVFVLNSAALLVFPPIGAALGLTQSQFGLWAALAIHDTSSVVGAAAKFGAGALAVGTTVKLARALWIVPLSVGTAAVKRTGAKVRLPWFVLFFAAASLTATCLPAGAPLYWALAGFARVGLTATLFLIGSGVSRATLRAAGARPLVLGFVLWAVVATLSLALIRAGILAI